MNRRSTCPWRTCLLLVLLAAPARGAGPPALSLDAAGDPLPPSALARLGTTRWRQYWSVVGVAWSADGKVLACATNEEGSSLFDAGTGRKLRPLMTVRDRRTAFALTADGRRLAVLDGGA